MGRDAEYAGVDRGGLGLDMWSLERQTAVKGLERDPSTADNMGDDTGNGEHHSEPTCSLFAIKRLFRGVCVWGLRVCE